MLKYSKIKHSALLRNSYDKVYKTVQNNPSEERTSSREVFSRRYTPLGTYRVKNNFIAEKKDKFLTNLTIDPRFKKS